MNVKSNNFTAVIEEFTANTYIMVVFSDQKVKPGCVNFNLNCAKKFFTEEAQLEDNKY